MRKSIELNYMEILNERCQLPSEDRWYLKRLLNGDTGEAGLVKIVEPLLPEGWVLLTDLAFNLRYGETQIDAVILSPSSVHMLEVKYLTGYYDYKDGVWTNNGRELSRDYFTQMKRAGEIFRGILRELGIVTSLDTKLVLMSEEDTVNFHDNSMEGLYLKRWQLKKYLRQIIENHGWDVKWDARELADILTEQTVKDRVPKARPSKLELERVYQGIVCCYCGSYKIDVTIERFHVACKDCGYRESNEKAILRTICDLGILFYDQPLRLGIMAHYLKRNQLVRPIKTVFNKYFTARNKGRFTEYVNPLGRFEGEYGEIQFRYKDYQGAGKSK